MDIFRLLEERDEELELILDSIQDAITIVDKNGITKYWNNAAVKMYGIKKEDLILSEKDKKLQRFKEYTGEIQ